ncbi:hypothetical protein [Stenoxybacter acetivorans]|uniref:hypothetical protein n=1 Tax=Stenoxybacter acetivorans TaxID=422441 RepID=UPI0012EB49DA|nr:hypothetical protein [Stenoxybacter acetivorans]
MLFSPLRHTAAAIENTAYFSNFLNMGVFCGKVTQLNPNCVLFRQPVFLYDGAQINEH